MLCHRCESRVKFLEEGHGSRAECGNVTCVDGKVKAMSVHGCYMYRPVKPVVLATDELEKEITKEYGVERPQFGPGMISARSHFVRVPEMTLTVKEFDDGAMLYWIPDGED